MITQTPVTEILICLKPTLNAAVSFLEKRGQAQNGANNIVEKAITVGQNNMN